MSGEQPVTPEPPSGAAERVAAVAAAIRPYVVRYDRTRDQRAVFAFVYFQITADLARRLRNTPAEFDDPDWVATLTEQFAAGFFRGMDGIDAWRTAPVSQPDSPANQTLSPRPPKPWVDVYLATSNGQSYVLEDLVFSMMAHISYDLPLALLEVAMEAGGRSHIADYHRMNDVLARQTDAIQTAVARRYSRTLAFLDRWVGNYDEFFTNYGIRLARSTSWYNACRLLDPSAAPAARESIARSTHSFIQSIRNPEGWCLRLLFRVARLIIPRRRTWPAHKNREGDL